MKKQFLIFVAAIFLVACSPSKTVESPISEIEYKQILEKAICAVVDELNARGELADAVAIEKNFDSLFENALAEMGYSKNEWLAAKIKYFSEIFINYIV